MHKLGSECFCDISCLLCNPVQMCQYGPCYIFMLYVKLVYGNYKVLNVNFCRGTKVPVCILVDS